MLTMLRPLLVLALFLPATGCKVIANAEDETPPRVELMYGIEGDTTWRDAEGMTIQIHKKGTLYLYACATDEAGPGLVMIHGAGSQRCNQAGGPVITPYSFYAETRATASPGELTPETLIVVETIEMSELCAQGGSAGSTLKYSASALLFNPTVSTQSGTLTVKVLK